MLKLNWAWFFLGGGALFIAIVMVLKEKIRRESWHCLLGFGGCTMIFSVIPLLLYIFLESLTANVIALAIFCLMAWRFARILFLLAAGVPIPSEISNRAERFEEKVKGKCHKNDRDESMRD